MGKSAKNAQLQVRVTTAEKSAIARLARLAGQDMSTYVLGRVLPVPAAQFAELVRGSAGGEGARLGLAELNSFLASLGAAELEAAVAARPAVQWSEVMANTVAAMVEVACVGRRVPVPQWVREVPPLAEPVFGSTLQSLRLHLLSHSPPPFRRRNLFVDATVGDRV
jgi:hypothetical protein